MATKNCKLIKYTFQKHMVSSKKLLSVSRNLQTNQNNSFSAKKRFNEIKRQNNIDNSFDDIQTSYYEALTQTKEEDLVISNGSILKRNTARTHKAIYMPEYNL